MKIKIKHRISGGILFTLETKSLKLAVEAAVEAKTDLAGAYLAGADLAGAYLAGAYLEGAYLAGAYLRGAYLAGAYLRGADLEGADLRGADLRGADLRGASLGGAYLRGAKGYADSHDFFFVLVGKQPVETFNEIEWAMIGQIAIHRVCWDTIQKRYGAPFLRVLEVLEAAGFEEYAVKYREVLGKEAVPPSEPAAEAAK
jgi:hypothetical protein